MRLPAALAVIAALFAALVLSLPAAADHVPLSWGFLSEDDTTTTWGWQAQEQSVGYDFFVNGAKVSSTDDPNQTSVVFAKTPGATYGIRVNLPGEYAEGQIPEPPNNLILHNQTFRCDNYPQPVDYDLVKVTIDAGLPDRKDAFHTGQRCEGRIGRIELVGPADGMKIQGGVHNLTIEGGYIDCLPVEGEVHQDGIQAMGGANVLLQNLTIDCGTNSAMFFNMGAGGQNMPTNIICDGCTLSKLNLNNRTVRIMESVNSGVRNSTIYWCGPSCPGPAVVIGTNAVGAVNSGNTVVQYP